MPSTAMQEEKKAAFAVKKFKPLHDRLTVRRHEAKTKTDSGLFIPDAAQDKPLKGTVLAVGRGKKNEHGELFPLDIQVGETVLFGPYSGVDIEVDGEKLLMMREEEVLGIYE
jgi:chaperonin GroES